MFTRTLACLLLVTAFCAPLWADIPPPKKGGCSASDDTSQALPMLLVVAAALLALRHATRSTRGRA